MRKALSVVLLFVVTCLVYAWIASGGTWHQKWFLDYFNPLATSLQHGQLSISPPGQTYDLIHFQGKWYAPWGLLPALLLLPLQIIKHGYVPTIYLSIVAGSINVCIAYLLLLRLKKEWFPSMSAFSMGTFLVLYALGTMNVYVATLGSSWHVDQIVTSVFGDAALLVILKKKRIFRDYSIANMLLAITLFGRPTLVLLTSIPFLLYLHDASQEKKRLTIVVKELIVAFFVPLGIGTLWYAAYNLLRFGNVLEYGYRYIQESPYLEAIRKQSGSFSFYHLSTNLWYMLLEIPALRLGDKGVELIINLKGNSILFLTPPYLASLLVWFRTSMRPDLKLFVRVLSVGLVVTMVPSLLMYSTGWMQFGYRYSLDISLVLLLLVVIGMKGKANILMVLGTLWAIWMHWLGIHALM